MSKRSIGKSTGVLIAFSVGVVLCFIYLMITESLPSMNSYFLQRVDKKHRKEANGTRSTNASSLSERSSPKVPTPIDSHFNKEKEDVQALQRTPGPSHLLNRSQTEGQGKQQTPPKSNKTKSETELDELLYVLQSRIKNYSGRKLKWTTPICDNKTSPARACYDTSCPRQFSRSPRERLQQILSIRRTIPTSYLKAMTSAAKRVTSHKYIFATGASSNHYKEMQSQLRNDFTFLFPRMKGEDYAFVFFDLGLTPLQRNLTEKYCRCTVLDFPFSRLPRFVKNLFCYAWKPLIISTLLEKSEYLVWMDTSVRWRDSTPLKELFQNALERGFQIFRGDNSIAIRSRSSMAEFFGDELCQYSPFPEVHGGFGFYHNDRFVREAIIKPWVACALNSTCMCVENSYRYMHCVSLRKREYQRCHRFDQSALGMIASKLFLENRPMFYLPSATVYIQKRDAKDWFNTLKHRG